MSYIGYINQFWKCNLEHQFTASDTRLFFYLLHTCNQLGWKMPFGHSDRHLASSTGLSVPTVRDCKNRLQKRGLLVCDIPKIKSKSFVGQSQYWFPTVQNSCTDGCTVPFTDGCTDGCTVPLTNNRLNRLDKTRQEYNSKPLYPFLQKNDFIENYSKVEKEKKEGKRRKVPPKEEKDSGLVFPFSSKPFSEAWEMLLQMPKWENKQSQSLKLALKKLSRYDEAFAIDLVEMAITNDWQGLIFQDTDFKYQQWKQNKLQDGAKTIIKRQEKAGTSIPETGEPKRNHKERF